VTSNVKRKSVVLLSYEVMILVHGNSECNAVLLIDQSVLFCGCDQSLACVALRLIFSSFSIKDEPSLLKRHRLIYFFS
jgi:hypothetical protein